MSIPISPASTLHSLSWVTDNLSDPKNPTACAGSFYSAMTLVAMAEEEKNGVLRSDQPEVQEMWSRVYRFIVQKRTDDELAAISRKMSTCRCVVDHHTFFLHASFQAGVQHDTGPGTNGSFHQGRNDTWRFLYGACRLLRMTMSRSKELSVVKGVSKKWPSNATELLPFGADNLVEALIQHDRVNGDLATLALLHQIPKFCGGLVYDSFIKFDAFNVMVIDPVRRAMDKALDSVEVAIANNSKAHLAWGFHLEQLAPTFYHTISEVFRPPARTNMHMLNGGETKVVQLLSIMLYLLPHFTGYGYGNSEPELILPTITRDAAENCRHVFRTWGMHLTDRPDIPLHPAVVARDKALCAELKLDADSKRRASNKAADIEIARAMLSAHLYTPCSAAGCSLTLKDSGAFKTCANCTVVGYCGRDCQIKDWKDSKLPHKSVCNVLHRIVNEHAGWKIQSKNCAGRNILGSHWPISLEKDLDLLHGLINGIGEARKARKISPTEFRMLKIWAERTMNQIHQDNLGRSGEYQVLDSTYHPGYDDYEQIIARLTNPNTLNGPKAMLINRQIKWPPQ